MKNAIMTVAVCGAMLGTLTSGPASASTIDPSGSSATSYSLNQCNTANCQGDQVNVQLSGSASGNGVDFNVTPAASPAPDGFAIQQFGFNFTPALQVTQNGGSWSVAPMPIMVSNLPTGWTVSSDNNMSQFGRMDVALKAPANSTTGSLGFTVQGLGLDNVGDQFVAKVMGGGNTNGQNPVFVANGSGPHSVTGADQPSPPAPVPLPAAAWLALSGLVGLVGVARPRKGRPIVPGSA